MLYPSVSTVLSFSHPVRQQALLAAISEKDANIALLELSSSKRKKAQEEVMALKREKDRLMHQLKQQVKPPYLTTKLFVLPFGHILQQILALLLKAGLQIQTCCRS